jgi:glycine cleavage system regulatory protein
MSDDLLKRRLIGTGHGSSFEAVRRIDDMADEITRLRAEVERLREELSLIAVMGHSDDPKVAARIAYHAVERARAALLREEAKALESP